MASLLFRCIRRTSTVHRFSNAASFSLSPRFVGRFQHGVTLQNQGSWKQEFNHKMFGVAHFSANSTNGSDSDSNTEAENSENDDLSMYESDYAEDFILDYDDEQGGQDNEEYASDGSEPFPYEVDWIKRGAVTEVKEQTGWGKFACWAFAPIAAIEGYIQIGTGLLPRLSVKEVVDNFPEYKTGGMMADAFDYAVTHGVHLSKEYPNVGFQKEVITIDDYEWLKLEDDDQPLIELVAKQPVAIQVLITGKDLDSYLPETIYTGLAPTDGEEQEHSMTIVGFKSNFWVVKNSYGAKWGNKGFMYVSRKSMLSILQRAMYPYKYDV